MRPTLVCGGGSAANPAIGAYSAPPGSLGERSPRTVHRLAIWVYGLEFRKWLIGILSFNYSLQSAPGHDITINPELIYSMTVLLGFEFDTLA